MYEVFELHKRKAAYFLQSVDQFFVSQRLVDFLSVTCIVSNVSEGMLYSNYNLKDFLTQFLEKMTNFPATSLYLSSLK